MAEQVAAAEVYTGRGGQMRGDNSGGAAIFDVPNIKADPNPYGPLAVQYLANEGRKAVKELELKQKRDKELADLSKLKIDNFWIQYQDEVQKDLDTKSQKLAEIQAAGGDNVRQDLQREQSKYQLELDGLAKTTEAARERFEAFVKGKELLEKSPVGTYDEEFYAQKMKELDSLINDGVDAQGNPIPKKNPKEVLDWLNDPNNYPIQAYANLDDIVEGVLPDYKQDGRLQYVDEKDLRENVDMWAAGNQPAIESLQKKYKLGSPKEVVEMIVTTGLNKKPNKRSPEPSGGGGINFGNTPSGLTVVPSYDKSLGGDEGRSNVVTYVPDNQNMKTIPLIDGNGTPYMTNAFVVKKEGGAYYVYADVVPTEDLEAEAEAEQLTSEQMLAQMLGGKSSSSKKKKMKFPVDNRVGETGNSNYETISATMGKPLEDFIGIDVTKGKSSAKPKGDSKGNTYDIKGKQYPKSEVEKQAKASGMSVQEYIDALNSMK